MLALSINNVCIFFSSRMGLELSSEQCSWCYTRTTTGDGKAVTHLHRCLPDPNWVDLSIVCAVVCILLSWTREMVFWNRLICYIHALFCPSQCDVNVVGLCPIASLRNISSNSYSSIAFFLKEWYLQCSWKMGWSFMFLPFSKMVVSYF